MAMIRRPFPRSLPVFLAGATLLTAGIFAQTAPGAGKAGVGERVAALKQSLAQNKAALKNYTWVETTTISLKGEVKKTEQKQCHYGPDGQVVKIPLAGAPPPPQQAEGGRRGRFKEAVKEHKVDELKDYMQQVTALIHQYVPPDPQKIQAAQAAGNVSMQASPSQGGAVLNVKDYLKPGDLLALGIDPQANQMRSYNVRSYLEKPGDDDVTLAVMFANLPDGTSFPQQTVLDAPGKKIQVVVTNSGYAKAAQ